MTAFLKVMAFMLLAAQSTAFLLRAGRGEGRPMAKVIETENDTIVHTFDGACYLNVFPDPTSIVKLQGFKQFTDVISADQLGKLQANLPSEWIIGTKWRLTFTAEVSSKDDVELRFGGGAFAIKIPGIKKGAYKQIFSVEDAVATTKNETRWEYTSKQICDRVVLSQICLQPVLCETFQCPERITKHKGDLAVGSTLHECCEPPRCETFACPEGMVTNPETETGTTESECCMVPLCPQDICNVTGWSPKPGSGLSGSNLTACCQRIPCPLWTCSNSTTMKNKGADFFGQSDEDCCADNFGCTADICKDPALKLKSDWNATYGSTQDLCCEPRLCVDYSCPNVTYFKPKGKEGLVGWSEQECCDAILCDSSPVCDTDDKTYVKKNFTGLLGNSLEQCCDRLSCRDYTCSNSTTLKSKGTDFFGNTDEQCCEQMFCTGNECISKPLTHKLKDGYAKIVGSTLDQCCDQQLCKDFDCGDASLWEPKNSTDENPLIGTTVGQCCKPVLCSAYNCSEGWARNRSARLGNTDEQCCTLSICEDFSCTPATKWIQKPTHISVDGVDQPRIGYRYEDCCTPIFCTYADVCSPGTKLANLDDSSEYQGSTQEECCTRIPCTVWLSFNMCNASNPGLEAVDYPHETDGSTAGECCKLKSCADYRTPLPTKYACDAGKMGWGDAQCCKQLSCADYKCTDSTAMLLAENIGSTDSECCVSEAAYLLMRGTHGMKPRTPEDQ